MLRRVAQMAAAVLLAALATLRGEPAAAVTIELKDVAADRVERQRAYAEGRLPLAGTPNLADLPSRLAAAGVKAGDQAFIRIFKAESELEVWLKKGDHFILFAIYPMCHWSGTLGPKVREGDRQNPEGFYTVGSRQLHRIGRWPRSLNLGFPNAFDRAFGRTGSYILVHGGCSSTGCFAMTNAVIEEIYGLASAALKRGQERIHVHVFPFRLTDANLAPHASSDWYDFWLNLKAGYDAFEASRLPPRVAICDKKYLVQAAAPEEAGDAGQGRKAARRDGHLPSADAQCPPSAPSIAAATGDPAEQPPAFEMRKSPPRAEGPASDDERSARPARRRAPEAVQTEPSKLPEVVFSLNNKGG